MFLNRILANQHVVVDLRCGLATPVNPVKRLKIMSCLVGVGIVYGIAAKNDFFIVSISFIIYPQFGLYCNIVIYYIKIYNPFINNIRLINN